VSSTGRRPSSFSERTASAEVGFSVSATTKMARLAVPRGGDGRLAAPLGGGSSGRELGRQGQAAVGEEGGSADKHLVAVHDTFGA
jgi:hypothetical protein